jgi:hypothetical protein
MAGDMLMPLLVIHRKTVDDAVWEDGWLDGQDFLIRSNDTSYLTPQLSKNISEMLCSNISILRAK